MSKKEFELFLKKQKLEDEKNKAVDWSGEKSFWLEQIDKFYGNVQEWLKKYREEGELRISFDSITLNEEHIGSYETRRLLLRMGNQEIIFAPIGTLLVGARGRIDMKGSAGKVRFVLVDKESTGMSISVRESTRSGDAGAAGMSIVIGDTEKDEKQIVWAWKISTPPPTIKYIDLNAESFYDSLLEVTNA